jgi:hypothetical protein
MEVKIIHCTESIGTWRKPSAFGTVVDYPQKQNGSTPLRVVKKTVSFLGVNRYQFRLGKALRRCSVV